MEDQTGAALRPAAGRARGPDRRRHRRQQPRLPPRPARLDRSGAARQGPAAQSRRLDRPRVELHLPGRPLARDDEADARQHAPVRGAGRASPPAAASRSRAPRSGWRSCAGGWRRRSRGASSPRSLLTPEEVKELVPFIDETVILGGFYCPDVSVVDSLRAGTLMRERAQEFGALTVVREHRGARHRRRARPRQARAHRRAATSRPSTVVVACGVWSPRIARDGRRVDPADACGAPDDRHRPGAALRRREGRDRVPDRARHGHEHVRAPGRRRPRGRLLRAPADPPRPRGDPVGRGGGALADRVPRSRRTTSSTRWSTRSS